MAELPPRERNRHLLAWRVRNQWPDERRVPYRAERRAMARRGEAR